jgi:hypothetical protein
MILDDDQFDRVWDEHFTHTAFRLEQLPAYEVASDRLDQDMAKVNDYDRWLAGATEPMWERKRPFLEILERERGALKLRYRVRILGGPNGLHPYEEYESAFAYAPNHVAGEDIFILDRAVRSVPSSVVDHDFWLLDGKAVIRMHYSSNGEFEAGELITDSQAVGRYLAARDAAMTAAEPFTAWWSRHPELHRAGVHAVA